MKITVTADLHPTSKEDHAEWFHASEGILQQTIRDTIGTLVIAGKQFDQEIQPFSEFEALCGQPKHGHARFHVTCGNHD